MNGVISIQSQVVFGHVGNGAAQIALHALGLDVWAMPTVLFSNHPGHGGHVGAPVPATGLSALLGGLALRDLLKDGRAVLSGYLGAADQVDVVRGAVAALRAVNPDAVFCCDPVIGDAAKGPYVAAGVPEGIAKHLVPLADMITPNAFELGYLTGREVRDPETAMAAARHLGCPLTVVTSVPLPGEDNRIGTLAVTPDNAWLCSAPWLEQAPPGTGDLFAALFLGHTLRGEATSEALQRAASSVDAVLQHTLRAGPPAVPEMDLIACREALRSEGTMPHLRQRSLSI